MNYAVRKTLLYIHIYDTYSVYSTLHICESDIGRPKDDLGCAGRSIVKLFVCCCCIRNLLNTRICSIT